MKSSKLRKIRIVVSLLFFVPASILFLDVANLIPPSIFGYITFFQFTPSAVKFFSLVIPYSIGFVIILVFTLLFGRVYCSSVCPLGTVQDIASHIANKKKRKKKFLFSKEYFKLRYIILAVTILSIFTGHLLILNLLDPFSNFGRIFSQLFNPLISFVNNFFAFTLEKLNIYFLYPIEIKSGYLVAALFPLIYLLVVLYLSYKRGRLYCNTICPVGTLLGLFSKFTIFKLKIDKTICENCGDCSKVCKAECIELKSKKIDFSRCVACYNCLDVCPSDAIKYAIIPSEKMNKKPDKSRRDFLSRTSLFFIGLTTTALAQIKIIPQKQSKIVVKKNSVSSPPGSKSIEHFTSNCTACHLCVTACPTRVLQPSFTEYGVFSIFQVFMDYKTSFCNYDCIACSEVCPTSAILPVTAEKKRSIQIGKAIFVEDNCIVKTENTACGACSEHCPTKAIVMVDYKGNLKIPEITNKYCVGCGACEFACPTKPYKAIYVDGNLYHQKAEKKPVEKLNQKIDYKEDFPF